MKVIFPVLASLTLSISPAPPVANPVATCTSRAECSFYRNLTAFRNATHQRPRLIGYRCGPRRETMLAYEEDEFPFREDGLACDVIEEYRS